MKSRREAFTLIEVLIVVVIMAVLAATIIPQFSTSTKDARESSLKFNLQSLRTQIELYKVQHNGLAPDLSGANANLAQLTKTTDVTGALNTTGAFGPYVQGSLPVQPFSGVNTVKAADTSSGAPTPTASPGGGWIYRVATGEIYIDHPTYVSW